MIFLRLQRPVCFLCVVFFFVLILVVHRLIDRSSKCYITVHINFLKHSILKWTKNKCNWTKLYEDFVSSQIELTYNLKKRGSAILCDMFIKLMSLICFCGHQCDESSFQTWNEILCRFDVHNSSQLKFCIYVKKFHSYLG